MHKDMANLKLSPVEGSTPREAPKDENTTSSVGYLGTPWSDIAPVHALALRQRFRNPSPGFIIPKTKTTLGFEVVASLIEATQRLVPADKTPQGALARRERDRTRAAEAKRAEQEFFSALKNLGYDCLSEDEQRGVSELTPDVRFKEPTLICGHMCLWIEYKDFFGFKANPFLAPKNRKQFGKYADRIGPGAVVYRLGFEMGHVNIPGVKCFREQEVRQSLTVQGQALQDK